MPRPPRVPLDLRGRVHHRPAGHRDRDQCRHGHRRAVAGRHVQPTRIRAVRLRRLRAVRRRLPDGGHRRRGRLAGRAPEAVQPVLDLRQQQDHHRGRHQPGVLRGRAGPVRRLPLGGAARRRRQRPGRAGRRLRRVPGRDRAPDADRGGQRHRLRLPEQGGHPRRARRAAGCGRGQGDQAVLRLAGGRDVPGADGGGRAHRGRDAPTRWRLRRDWEALFARYADAVPGAGRAAQPHAAAHPARRLGRRPPQLPGRRQGRGRPRRQRHGAQRGRRRGCRG